MNFRTFIIIMYTFIISIPILLTLIFDIFIGFRIYDFFTRLWAKGLIFISGMEVNVTGLENIKQNKKYVVIGNHLSQMEVPPLLKYFPGKLRFVYKKELGIVPFFGWILMLIHIKVDRKNLNKSKKSFRRVERDLSSDFSVLIFPEGTRSRTGEIQKFKKGAFIISIQNNIDLLPYAVYGTREILYPNSLKIYPGKVFIKFGNSISVDNYTYEKRDDLITIARDKIIKMYDELRKEHRIEVEINN